MKFAHKGNALYFLIFGFVFLFSLLAHIPASLVVNRLPSMKEIVLSAPQGSIWKGSVSQLKWKNQDYGELSWDIQFSKLLQAKLEAAVQLTPNDNKKMSASGFLGIGLNGFYARKLVASLPVSRLTSQITLPMQIVPDGQLELTIDEAQYATPWCKSAQGTLKWDHAKLELPLGSLGLGTVITDFECNNSKIKASGQQKTAQISSAFSAELEPNNQNATYFTTKGSYRSQLWFKPEVEFPITMKNQLSWLGNTDDQGRYQFNYQDKF